MPGVYGVYLLLFFSKTSYLRISPCNWDKIPWPRLIKSITSLNLSGIQISYLLQGFNTKKNKHTVLPSLPIIRALICTFHFYEIFIFIQTNYFASSSSATLGSTPAWIIKRKIAPTVGRINSIIKNETWRKYRRKSTEHSHIFGHIC